MQNESINDATAIKHGMYVGFRFLLLPILTLTSTSTFAFGFPMLQAFSWMLVPAVKLATEKCLRSTTMKQCCALLSTKFSPSFG